MTRAAAPTQLAQGRSDVLAKPRRRLELCYPHNGVTAVVEMLEEFAPRTCATVWQALETPAQGVLRQAKYVGCEVLLELPVANRNFDPSAVPVYPMGSGENLTWLPSPGDILWGYFPPYYLAGRPEALWEIVMIYGRDSKVVIAAGLTPLNHFAVVTENFEAWAETCRSILEEGARELIVRRLT
jgi:hypothetical protein